MNILKSDFGHFFQPEEGIPFEVSYSLVV